MAKEKSKLKRWLEGLPNRYSVYQPKQENDVRKLCNKLANWWTSFQFPLLFVFIGTSLIVACSIGVIYFDPSLLETDLSKLVSPMSSETLDHQRDLLELFGDNMTAHDFYPHQTILQGYDLTVLLQNPANGSFFSTEALEEVQNFHVWVTTNITVPGENGELLDFRDLCALQDGHCVVKGAEIFEKTFLSAEENNTVSYPKYNSLDLSGIFGDVHTSNGTMTSAAVLKLKYFLRYDTTYFKDKSVEWISKFPRKDSFRNISIVAALSLLESYDVEMLYFSILLIPLFFMLYFIILFIPIGCVLTAIILVATIGTVSYLQIPLTTSMVWVSVPIMDRVYANFELGRMKRGEEVKQKDRHRYLLVTFFSIVFFGVGMSSKFLVVYSFCTVACIAMAICFVVTLTVYSLHLKIGHRFTGSRTRCCCKCPSTTKEDSDDEDKSVSTGYHQKRRNYIVFIIVGVLYLGYLGLAGYGLSKQPSPREFCDSLSPNNLKMPRYNAYHNFCRTNEEAFGKDFMLTLTVKINGAFDLNETEIKTSSLIDAAMESNRFDKEYVINWMMSYLDDPLYKNDLFDDPLLKFLDTNKLHKNDVRMSENGSNINAFRVYLKTLNVSGSKDILDVMTTSRKLEENAELDCFFYAPEFLLYEGSLSYTVDFYKITAISGGVLVLSLALGFYHYHYALALVFVALASILFGVVGFARFYGIGFSFLSSVTVPFLCTYTFESLFIPKKDIPLRSLPHFNWFSAFCYITLFTVVPLLPMMQLNLFVEVLIPISLFIIFLTLHYIIFIPRLVTTWIGSDRKLVKGSDYSYTLLCSTENCETSTTGDESSATSNKNILLQDSGAQNRSSLVF